MLTRLLFLCAVLPLVSVAAAQDFRVYTTVRADESSEVLSRSLTLFHAGRTYDQIEKVGEVVIGDPAHGRFTLIRHGTVGTRVTAEELTHFRRVGRDETRRYAEQLLADSAEADSARSLLFQIDPRFRVRESAGRLTLESTPWTYNVQTARPAAAEHAAAYADYADRAATLNYVLHPQSFFPAAREALNEELRTRGLVPTKINLGVRMGQPVRLTAEHRFDWSLHPSDRSLIQKWERMADSPDLEWVGFREYQSRLMTE